MSACSLNGIPVVLLKGAVLAPLVYRDIAVRPMGDLDLLVRRSDVEAADQLVRGLGYVQRVATPSHHPAWGHQHLPPYVSSDGALLIELHHDIVPAGAFDMPIEDLWARSRPVRVSSVRALSFAPEDLLLHLCLHLAYSHVFSGMLKWICDIAAVIRAYGDELDWDELVRRAQIYSAGRHIHYALWLASAMVDATVPESVVRALEHHRVRPRLRDISLKLVIVNRMTSTGRPEPIVPVWLGERTCLELLGSDPPWRVVRNLAVRIRAGLIRSARLTVGGPAWMGLGYGVLVHPLYLLLRRLGSRFMRSSPKTVY